MGEVDLDDRVLEIRVTGELIDTYSPYDDHLFVLPSDWLDFNNIRPNDVVSVWVDEKQLTAPFSEDYDILTDTATYKFGGITISPDLPDDEDEDEDEDDE